jgi:tetratricopeptide (TPR) repeat protein
LKYIVDGIFFKFAIDVNGLYGGNEASQKAAAHELKGLRSYLDFLGESGERRLNVGLLVLIDFKGYRLIATSLLPIGGDSLVYGSDDGGKSVHKDIGDVNSIMKAAGRYIGMKGHRVGFQRPCKLYAPCDIECHLGVDGRYWVCDTARCFSPEVPSQVFVALELGQDVVGGGGASSSKCVDGGRPVELPPIAEVELTVRDWQQSARDLLGGAFQERSFVGGTVVFTGTGERNSRASALVGAEVRGDALALPAGFHGKRLYNLFRPEFVRQQCAETPLSPDSYTGFGLDNYKEHHAEARAASARLRQRVIPEFVSALDEHRLVPLHGASLTRMMHEAGINMRYLGVLRSLAKDRRVRALLATEMISRSAKNIMREHMRNTATRDELYAATVEHLNLLLGASEASTNYWALFVRIQLLAKFAAYNVQIWRDDAERDNLRRYVSKPSLLVALQRKTGIVLKGDAVASADFERARPFQVDDIVDIDASVKRLVETDTLVALVQRHTDARSASAMLTLDAKLADADAKLRLFTDVFGPVSAPATAMHLQRAHHYAQHGALGDAREALDAAVQCSAGCSTSLDLAVAALYVAGTLYEALGQAKRAERAYRTALAELASATGSLDALALLASSPNNDEQQAIASHPFAMFVIDRLVRLLLRVGRVDEAKYLSLPFLTLWQDFFMDGTALIRERMFGTAVPAALALYCEANTPPVTTLSGIGDRQELLHGVDDERREHSVKSRRRQVRSRVSRVASSSSSNGGDGGNDDNARMRAAERVKQWHRSIAITENLAELALAPSTSLALERSLASVFVFEDVEEGQSEGDGDGDGEERCDSEERRLRAAVFGDDARAAYAMHVLRERAFKQLEAKWPAFRRAPSPHSHRVSVNKYELFAPFELHVNDLPRMPLLWQRPSKRLRYGETYALEQVRLYAAILEPQTAYVDNEYEAAAPLAVVTLPRAPLSARHDTVVADFPQLVGRVHFGSLAPSSADLKCGHLMARLYTQRPRRDDWQFECASQLVYVYDDFGDVADSPMTYRWTSGCAVRDSFACCENGLSAIEVLPSLGGGTAVLSVAMGDAYKRPFAIAATASGVYAWGDNTCGQLGLGVSGAGGPPVPLPTPIRSLRGRNIVKLAVSCSTRGGPHCVALSARGNVYTWGSARLYQLGHGDQTEHSTPRIVQAMEGKGTLDIAAGASFTAACTRDGDVYLWGSSGSPSPLTNDEGKSVDKLTHPTLCVPLASVAHVVSIAAGPAELMAVTNIGHVYHAGDLTSGGFCYSLYRSYAPVRVLGDQFAVRAVVSHGHRYVLTAGGAVYSYGLGRGGALGNGSLSDCFSLVSLDHAARGHAEHAHRAELLADVRVVDLAARGDSAIAVSDGGECVQWGGGMMLPRRVTALVETRGAKHAWSVATDGLGRFACVTSAREPRSLPAIDDALRARHAHFADAPTCLDIVNRRDRYFPGESVRVRWSRPLQRASLDDSVSLFPAAWDAVDAATPMGSYGGRQRLPLAGTSRERPFIVSGELEFTLPNAYTCRAQPAADGTGGVLLEFRMVNKLAARGDAIADRVISVSECIYVAPPSIGDFEIEIEPRQCNVRESVSIRWSAPAHLPTDSSMSITVHEIEPPIAAGDDGDDDSGDERDENEKPPCRGTHTIREEGDATAAGQFEITLWSAGTMLLGLNQRLPVERDNADLTIRVIDNTKEVVARAREKAMQASRTAVAQASGAAMSAATARDDADIEALSRLSAELLRATTGSDDPRCVSIEVMPSVDCRPLTPLTVSWSMPEESTPVYTNYIGLFAVDEPDDSMTMMQCVRALDRPSGSELCFGVSLTGIFEARYVAHNPDDLTKRAVIARSEHFKVAGTHNTEAMMAARDEIVRRLQAQTALMQQAALRYQQIAITRAAERQVAVAMSAQQKERDHEKKSGGGDARMQSAMARVEAAKARAQAKVDAMRGSKPSSSASVVKIGSNISIGANVVIGQSAAASSEDSFSVRAWLQSFRFERFADQFIENGYDDLELIVELDDDDLDSIGIDKAGFRKKIKLQVAKLKKSMAQQ